jgi:hypothetical protein
MAEANKVAQKTRLIPKAEVMEMSKWLRFSLPEVGVGDATAMRAEVARVEAARTEARIDEAVEAEEARVEAKEERWL